jgi:hypothetical protein
MSPFRTQVTDDSLALILQNGNPHDPNIPCDPDTGLPPAVGGACNHQDPTGDANSKMFTIIEGHSSCTEGHIEPG